MCIRCLEISVSGQNNGQNFKSSNLVDKLKLSIFIDKDINDEVEFFTDPISGLLWRQVIGEEEASFGKHRTCRKSLNWMHLNRWSRGCKVACASYRAECIPGPAAGECAVPDGRPESSSSARVGHLVPVRDQGSVPSKAINMHKADN